MLRSIDKRLRKLESQQLAELDKEEAFGLYFALFLLDALGYYLGDPKPHEAPGAATARALGYAHEDELNQPWRGDSEFAEKYERAKSKLFAKFGVDSGTADGQKIADAAKRIYAELPASYKASARVKPIHHNVWRCRTPAPGGPILRNSCVFTRDVRRHFDRYGARTSGDVA
jgi:hypothetical protein